MALPTLTTFIIAAFFAGFAPKGIAASCPNAQFRTGPAANLPDCRAYELASPVEKNGFGVEGYPNLLQASLDGTGVLFFGGASTQISTAGAAGAQTRGTYLARLSAETWNTQRLLPPTSFGNRADYLGTTPDFRFAFVEATTTPEEEPFPTEPGHGLFELDTESGVIETIVPKAANQIPSQRYAIDGAAGDGSLVAFETRADLTPDAAEGVVNLYVWRRSTGAIELAGVLPEPEGIAPPGGSFGGAYEWFTSDDTSVGGATAGQGVERLNALSVDAEKLFFTAGETGQLYLRRGLRGSDPTTVAISVPNSGVEDPIGPAPAVFQEATTDGSRAFFLSTAHLTSNATTGEGQGRDLYRWDEDTESLTDLTTDTFDEFGAQVQGVLGISQDGSVGYFAALGTLAPGATAGELNLYEFDSRTGATQINFIATLAPLGGSLSGSDLQNWSPKTFEGIKLEGYGGIARTAEVTSDGSTLLFASNAPLTGYDNQGYRELYRYEAAALGSDPTLECISCNPSIEASGSAELQAEYVNYNTTPPSTFSVLAGRTHNLSADGGTIFFESPDALVSQDVNGATACPRREIGAFKSECVDVYEWQALGRSDQPCTGAVIHNGCVSLISTGQSPNASEFAGASLNGSVVFFVTTSQLVPLDTDPFDDVYAARVDGGMATQFSEPTAACSGEECQGGIGDDPSALPSTSAQISGEQNYHGRHHRRKHRRTQHHKKRHRRHQSSRHKKSAHRWRVD